jgi:ribosomal protein L29
MKKQIKEDLRKLSYNDLNLKRKELEFIIMGSQKKLAKPLGKPENVKNLRKQIALINTIINERLKNGN